MRPKQPEGILIAGRLIEPTEEIAGLVTEFALDDVVDHRVECEIGRRVIFLEQLGMA